MRTMQHMVCNKETISDCGWIISPARNLPLGATVVRLGERPFFIKQNYGDDPIRNTMYG